MDREEVPKKLAEAKAWITIIEESQKTREKYGKQLRTGFRLESGNDAASARVAVDELEKSVYGGFLGALHKRIENIERAFLEGREGEKQ